MVMAAGLATPLVEPPTKGKPRRGSGDYEGEGEKGEGKEESFGREGTKRRKKQIVRVSLD